MEPELSSVDFLGEEWNKHCGSLNKWEHWIVFVHQDSKADCFRWQSMVTLLSSWEHTGMERLKMNEKWG